MSFRSGTQDGVDVVLLICDRVPMCNAHLTDPPHRAERDYRGACKRVVIAAEAAGWQLSPHGDVPLDFCPTHVDPERPGLKITPLYDEHGKALPYRSGR